LRLMSHIPVVLMGETGCGKTRLVKFFSQLYEKEYQPANVENILIHVKVHGGTTAEFLSDEVTRAERLSRSNWSRLSAGSQPTTKTPNPITCLLFFDEANTTEHVGLIKEIMCDLSVNGRAIDVQRGLKMIAAVNPYRKHSDERIRQLENAGLGFYKSSERIWTSTGWIPMRQLVYRVQPLPTSLQPLVWDFGQLEKSVESVYTRQLVRRRLVQSTEQEVSLIVELLTVSQEFMRSRDDECSFVSIRDIERVILVTNWFLAKSNIIFPRMSAKLTTSEEAANLSDLMRSFLLSLLVCYHCCLFSQDARLNYRTSLSEKLNLTAQDILNEAVKCQLVFVEEIDLNNKNIACNAALLENVFMMIVCIELRIPLFIVGKPGSSKSLAKSIVIQAMKGPNSTSELFRQFKTAYFVNFQCSPLTTSEMILKTFEEAHKIQESCNTEKLVAVVNLDEIGLAEASESMPLKTLHPLLESNTDVDPKSEQRVAVIGISNWALDPAKMNRGIFVARGDPDITELIDTAKGICETSGLDDSFKAHLAAIARGYLQICTQACEYKREFFGLRDFYSLIKMLNTMCKETPLNWTKLEYALRRNFGGLEIDILEPFRDIPLPARHEETPASSLKTYNLIESALTGEFTNGLGRYLLFLTDNNTAVDLIQAYMGDLSSVQVIFGSSFRLDQEYTEICRNVSLIKNSMELGRTLILLNTYNLYESLYDALNQYYYEFAGQKYVDLGLGTHRVKCSVHENFRLIIIAEKSAVYDTKRFPIPLLNRLEKHFLNSALMLTSEQRELVDELDKWQSGLLRKQPRFTKLNEIFIGFSSDTNASLIRWLCSINSSNASEAEIVQQAKVHLLKCASPEFVLRSQDASLKVEYFQNQAHLALEDLLRYHLEKSNDANRLVQITSHSKSSVFNVDLNSLGFDSVQRCLVNTFDTQLQFIDRLKSFLGSFSNRLLLLQIEINSKYDNDLLACVRHLIVETIREWDWKRWETRAAEQRVAIALVVLVPRENVKILTGGGCQFGSCWSCYHVDELESTSNDLVAFDVQRQPLSELLKKSDVDKLRVLFKRLAQSSCSMLVDKTIERTITRVDLFIRLCEDNTLVYSMAKRLFKLQLEKESLFMVDEMRTNWLLKEVAQAPYMGQYSTLRRARDNYIEGKLAPLLAYVLATVDSYANLDIYQSAVLSGHKWIANLWLSILDDESLCKLDYVDMRSKQDSHSKELTRFVCKSEWTQKMGVTLMQDRPSLPFFWLLVSHLGLLHASVKKPNAQVVVSSSDHVNQVGRLFQEGSLYKLLNESNVPYEQIFDFYLGDFLLINCHVNRLEELVIVKRVFVHAVNEQCTENGKTLRYGLPLAHYVYDRIGTKLDVYLKLSRFEPRLNTELRSLLPSDYHEFHLNACIRTLELFREDFTLTNLNLDRLFCLFQLVQQHFLTNGLAGNHQQATTTTGNQKLATIRELFQSLSVIRYLLDVFERYNFDEDLYAAAATDSEDSFIRLFNQHIKPIYLSHFSDPSQTVDFKKTNTILRLHSFVIQTNKILNETIK
jgi:energy-coupling factor transporter ATP-binding protein EcfA2